ncbi:peptidase A2 [Leptospira fletcheri]|uniref:Peptidase A2 n=1 Tax=Leptospira fletcheri TaxID=2484981 RepID=A0A4R9GJY2_9LEPT|nr:peptidase A2 [Leptospira fletcheri]TGK13076.1 peptidase A2 [Leptospira fletcheri]
MNFRVLGAGLFLCAFLPAFSPVESKQGGEFFLLVHFRKYSHHNPFQKGVPFQKRVPAIRLDEKTALALLKPGDIPLFAEMHPDESAGRKAYFEKVDPETGLGILTLPNDMSRSKKRIPFSHLEPHRNSKTCSSFFPTLEWASLENSRALLPLSRISRKEGTEPVRKFLISHGFICGFTDGSWNGGADLLRRFYFNRGMSPSPFPHPGFTADTSLTPAEENYYFPKGSVGVVVSEVLPGVGPMHNLFPGDAILSVNGIPVSSKDKQALYDLILRRHGVPVNSGENVHLSLYRDGRRRELSYHLRPYDEDSFLIPERTGKSAPRYLISGGLLFTELTQSYLKEFGEKYKSSAERKLVYLAESFSRKLHPEKKRIVLLSRTFPDEKNRAYQEFQDLILESVNDKIVDSIDGLKEILATSKDDFYVFRFAGNKIVVFTKEEAKDLDSRIKSLYSLDTLDNVN